MRVVWVWAALFTLLAPSSVVAQYGSAVPGTLDRDGFPGELAPLPAGPKDLGIPRRGQRAWEIYPIFLADETYTDNVRLGPVGLERSDWVTRLAPGVLIYGNGPRLRLTASYSPEILARAQEGTIDIFHHLKANGDAELMQQLLFVDASARVSQQDVSLFGPLTESNVNVTENRTTVGAFSLSPYLRRDFGRNVQGEARLTYSTVNTGKTDASINAAAVSDSSSNRIDLRLISGPAYKRLTWNVAYSKERIDYESGQNIEIDRISAAARRLITPTLGLQANVGYEDNNYVTSGPALDGAFWSVGPEWTPTPRTRLVATAGRRFDKPHYSLDFSHRTRLTTWSVDYKDDITTQRQQILVPTGVDTIDFLNTLFLSRISDPVARQQAVQAFIIQTGLPPTLIFPVNFFTTTPFEQKQWRASFGIHGVRNAVLANVFRMTREATAVDQTATGAGDFAFSKNTKQTGTSLIWTLRMTAQTTSNVSVGYTRNEFLDLGRKDDLMFIRLSLTRQLDPRMSGSLNFRRLQNDSNQNGAGYRENAVMAGLNLKY